MGDTCLYKFIKQKCRKKAQETVGGCFENLDFEKVIQCQHTSSDNIEVDFQDDNDDDGACSSSYACCPQQVLPEYDEIDSIVHFSFGIHVLHLIMIKMRHLIRQTFIKNPTSCMDSDSESDKEK